MLIGGLNPLSSSENHAFLRRHIRSKASTVSGSPGSWVHLCTPGFHRYSSVRSPISAMATYEPSALIYLPVYSFPLAAFIEFERPLRIFHLAISAVANRLRNCQHKQRSSSPILFTFSLQSGRYDDHCP